MAAGKWIRKDSSGSPGTLISEQTKKEIVEVKQYALVETSDVAEIEIDKTIYAEATEFDEWFEEFAGQYYLKFKQGFTKYEVFFVGYLCIADASRLW